MYFHLVGIKEKNGKKYELDFLLQGGDEDFLRRFLSNRGVVIVSLTIFDGNTKDFGNISIHVKYDDSEVQILMAGDKLEEVAYFICFLGLSPTFINYINQPIDDESMHTIIDITLKKVKMEDERAKREKEEEEKREQEKYSESAIEQGLKVINKNINRIEQVLKAGQGIISGSDFRNLENLLDELKKIRLGTNFNKMVALVLQSHELVDHAEREICTVCDNQKVLVDENSCITNIDFISGLYEFNKITEKGTISPKSLTNYESIYNIFGVRSTFFIFLYKDFLNSFKSLSFTEIFHIVLAMVELILLIIIILISIICLILPIFGMHASSLYVLPALGRGGLLLYLFNNLRFKGGIGEVVVFLAIVFIFFIGLQLLKGTFSI